MLSYCLRYRGKTESKNPRVLKANGKTIHLSKCAVCGRCDSKKSRFSKEQEASGLL